ncbi:hypothetical protein ACTMSW_08740 [Micromonospora sp. BQ11]|uniref:hypothetical protein n=1 Tax=Micromonospora sp. BQ11 TaxID=3452212 RepID=UPI003F89BC17
MRYRPSASAALVAVSITAAVLTPSAASAATVQLTDRDTVTVPITGGPGEISLSSISKLSSNAGSLTTQADSQPYLAQVLWQSVRYHRTTMTLTVEGTTAPGWLARVPHAALDVVDGNTLTVYCRSTGSSSPEGCPVKATARYQPGSTYRHNTTHTVDLGLTGVYTLSTTIGAPL